MKDTRILNDLSFEELISINGGQQAPTGGDRHNVGNCFGCGIAVAENWIEKKWDSFMSNFMNKLGSI
jgi:hypothetical protein